MFGGEKRRAEQLSIPLTMTATKFYILGAPPALMGRAQAATLTSTFYLTTTTSSPSSNLFSSSSRNSASSSPFPTCIQSFLLLLLLLLPAPRGEQLHWTFGRHVVHVCSSASRHFGGKFGISGAEEEKGQEEELEGRGRWRKGKWKEKRRSFLRRTLTRMQTAGCAENGAKSACQCVTRRCGLGGTCGASRADFGHKLERRGGTPSLLLGPEFGARLGESQRVTSESSGF